MAPDVATNPGTVPPAAVLAVDVGNSKTDLALVAADGTLLAAGRGPTSSHQAVGLPGAMSVLRHLAVELAAAAGIDAGTLPLASVGVYCMAGADLPSDVRRLQRALARVALSARDFVENDTLAVLRAGSPDRWGVAVVCGAGINCRGRAPDGREVRFAALGEISGDWGGGPAVGMAGLAAAVRGRDGRGPRTSLERLVPAHFGRATPDSVTRGLYLGRIPEGRVQELAAVVFGAARDGDPVAAAIVDRQADEIVAMAGAAIRRLRLARTPVPVVLGGGIFRARDRRLLERIAHGIAAIAPKAIVERLDAPPVLGSALLGLDLLGAPPEAGERVRRALAEDMLARLGPPA